MSAVRSSMMALALLAGCGGNPFATVPEEGSNDSISTLSTTTTTLSPNRSVERHEVKVTSNGSDLGNGFAFQDGQIHYNAANDTFSVDNLAFDGGNVYHRDTTMDGTMTSDVRAYAGDGTATDNQTGATIDQFQYRALYGESSTGRSHFAIVRTGAYLNYGFGGFIYSREGKVTLPTSGFAVYNGSYTALRDTNGIPGDGQKLAYVTGDMSMQIDFNDFNASESGTRAGAVHGTVSGRRVFDLDGNDITASVIASINTANGFTAPDEVTELPSLLFNVGPGALDVNGEMEGGVTSIITDGQGGAAVFEEGKYYAVVSGTNADEVTGVIVVTSTVGSATLRETGGFILYRP